MELTTKGISTLVTVLLVVSIGMVGFTWLQSTTTSGEMQQERSSMQEDIDRPEQQIEAFQGAMKQALKQEGNEESNSIALTAGNEYTGSNYQYTYWMCANTEQIPTEAAVKDALEDRLEKEVDKRASSFGGNSLYLSASDPEISVDVADSSVQSPNPDADTFNITAEFDEVKSEYIPTSEGIVSQRKKENVEVSATLDRNRFWYMYHTLHNWTANTTGLGDEVRNAIRLLVPDHRRVRGACVDVLEDALGGDFVSGALETIQQILSILETVQLLCGQDWFPVPCSFTAQFDTFKQTFTNACAYGASVVPYSSGGEQPIYIKGVNMAACIAQRGDPEIDKDTIGQQLRNATRVGLQEEMHELEEELGFNGNDVSCRFELNKNDGDEYPGYKIESYTKPIPPNDVKAEHLSCIGPIPFTTIFLCPTICKSWGYSLGYEVYVDANIVCQDTRYTNTVPTTASQLAERIKLWNTDDELNAPIQPTTTPIMWNINLSFQVSEKEMAPSPAGPVPKGNDESFPAEGGPQTFQNCYVGDPPDSGGDDDDDPEDPFCEPGTQETFHAEDRTVKVENQGTFEQDGKTFCFARNKTSLGSQSNGEDWRINLNYTENREDYIRVVYNETSGDKAQWVKNVDGTRKSASYFDDGKLEKCSEDGTKIRSYEKKWTPPPDQELKHIPKSCLDTNSFEDPYRYNLFALGEWPEPTDMEYVVSQNIDDTDFCDYTAPCWGEGEMN